MISYHHQDEVMKRDEDYSVIFQSDLYNYFLFFVVMWFMLNAVA